MYKYLPTFHSCCIKVWKYRRSRKVKVRRIHHKIQKWNESENLRSGRFFQLSNRNAQNAKTRILLKLVIRKMPPGTNQLFIQPEFFFIKHLILKFQSQLNSTESNASLMTDDGRMQKRKSTMRLRSTVNALGRNDF